MKARSLLALLVFCTAVQKIAAAEKTLELNAAYLRTRAVETFPDPIYVGETDYISSNAEQGRIGAHLAGFFASRFTLTYQGLSVKSYSELRQANSYRIAGYYTSYLSAMAATDTGIFRWHYGFAALLTFANRTYADAQTGVTMSDRAIDTRLSQVYPSGGLTLFANAPIRFSMIFLNGDANLLYGWLRLSAEFETDSHIFSPGFELLNHASFGKGIPNFVQPPGAATFGYAYKWQQLRFGLRLGFVLNSRQGFDNARVGFTDRLLFETSVAWLIDLH